MADRFEDPRKPTDPNSIDPVAVEWLYDTLAETPTRSRRRFPVWTSLAFVVGASLVAGVLWLLLGTAPLAGLDLQVVATPTASPAVRTVVEATSAPPQVTASPAITATATPAPDGPFGVGDRVAIAGTGPRGLRLRAGPGLKFATVTLYKDGNTFIVVPSNEESNEYPLQVDGYRWWRLRAPDGTLGWTVEDYLTPAPLLPPTATPTAPG